MNTDQKQAEPSSTLPDFENIVEPIDQPQVISPEKPPSRKYLVLVIASLIAISFAILAVFLFKQSNFLRALDANKYQPEGVINSLNPSIESTTSEASNVDEGRTQASSSSSATKLISSSKEEWIVSAPDDWKLYKNEKLKYSFRYPSNLILSEQCYEQTNTVCVKSPDYKIITRQVPEGEGGVDSEVVGVDGYEFSVELPENPYAFDGIESICMPGGWVATGECELILINNRLYAVLKISQSLPFTGWQAKLIENNLVVVKFDSSASSESLDESIPISKKIISTFEFDQ